MTKPKEELKLVGDHLSPSKLKHGPQKSKLVQCHIHNLFFPSSEDCTYCVPDQPEPKAVDEYEDDTDLTSNWGLYATVAAPQPTPYPCQACGKGPVVAPSYRFCRWCSTIP